ncbi:type IX secretion system membrane protein PorP/SprF [Lacinutrix sp. WUR7]|uniref:PorP/SprF family type IX secretion system membrane protein n=1 Tax=Lacinutrix sp. WUR7 TaxID=2653681 RepID=UPI00193E911E|nr:type IX secretion system membrane protein PorP/SprF [Lacinutrix sp. WUR7]QRM89337.1 type IX secretion system membrane protein PorP/SprF [Lacinutrix sp. WUR7]
MKKTLLVIALFFGITQCFFGQEEDGVISLAIPVRNSLKFNRFNINPTFSFVREQNKYISINNKREWVQFEDAPQTYLLSYSGRFRENIGVGIGFFQQNYGVLTSYGGILNLAYNAMLQPDSNLTFGLNIGFYQSGINEGKVVTNVADPSLENIPSNSILSVSPGINYGTVFFDFGLSVNNLVQYNFKTSQLLKEDPQQVIQAHIMYTGYMSSYGFLDESKFSGIIKSEFKKDKTVLSGLAMLTVPKGIWGQVGYNTQYGISGGIGLNITSQIAIEYNYEKAIGDLSAFGSSHDITLAYKFKNTNNFYYSGDDEEETMLFKKKKRRVVSSKPKVDLEARAIIAKEKADARALAQAKIKEKADARAAAKAAATENRRLTEETTIPTVEEVEEESVIADTELQAKAQADEEARLAAEAAAKSQADEEARLAAEAATKAQAEEDARLAAEAAAKSQADEEARLAAEAATKAQAAENARLAAEAATQAQADEEARLAAEAATKAQVEEEARLAAEAATKAQAEEDARLAAEAATQAQAEEDARLAAEATAQAQADEDARLAAEAAAQAQADEDARLAAEATAQAQADEDARLAAEAAAQTQADEDARLAAEAAAQTQADEDARLAAEADKALEKEASLSEITQKDVIAKEMFAITESAKISKEKQDALLAKLNEAVASKDKDLKDLKEENDLSEKGIYSEPKPFKSIAAENRMLESLKTEVDQVIQERGEEIVALENLYNNRLKDVSNKKDETNQYYLNAIQTLKEEQLQSKRAKEQLVSTLESIKIATDFERKRRIKRAVYDNEKDRYLKDKATLESIIENTPLSNEPITEEDFDFGEAQSATVQILKGMQNIEEGYYIIIAVHSDKEKRDDFIEKVVSTGQSNINFFFDVNTNKYFIYYEKFDYVEEAMRALEAKGSKPYNGKMSVIKIEN